LYWKGIRKHIRGGHIGAQHLQCTAKKGGVTHQLRNMQLAVATIELKIRQAYKLYSRLK